MVYQTEPSGAYSLWKANAIGRNSTNLREFIEKNYEDGMSEQKTVRLAIETLLEVVESSKNISLCVIRTGNKSEMVDDSAIDAVVKQIEKEKEEAEQAKQK